MLSTIHIAWIDLKRLGTLREPTLIVTWQSNFHNVITCNVYLRYYQASMLVFYNTQTKKIVQELCVLIRCNV